MHEKENVLRILEGTKKAIQEENSIEIRNLSNQTINTASMTQDPDNIAVAVIVYSLSKIVERRLYLQFPGWDAFYKKIISALDSSIEDIKQNKEEEFRKDFGLIQQAIGKLSGKLKKYIQAVFERAKINKASRIYEHGISMEQTAKLLGITMFELAEYAGKTGISDVPLGKTVDVKSRLKLMEEMFL